MKKLFTISFSILLVLGFIFTSCQKQNNDDPETDALKVSIKDLQRRCDSLADALAATNANIAGVRNTVDSLQSKLAVLTGQINQLIVDLNSTNAHIATITAQIAILNEQYATLLAKLNALLAQCGHMSRTAIGVIYLKDADSIVIDTSKWHYVALTKNNLNGNFYLDGNLILNSTFDNVSYVWNSLLLGATQACSSCSPMPNYRGIIDEVRISNVARTFEEISNSFNANLPFSADASTIGLFHFDAPNGTVMTNSAGSTNGILYGSPIYTPGKFGQGLNLNGTADYARYSQSLPVNTMTLEFWFYANTSIGTIAMLEGVFNTGIGLDLITP